MKKQERVIFYIIPLDADKASLVRKKSGKPLLIPSSLAIPSWQKVTGEDGQPRYIRYLSHESSIYVDKQNTPFNPQVDPTYGKVMNVGQSIISDKDGRIFASDKMLIEYLRAVKENVENSKRNKYRGKVIAEYNPKRNKAKRFEAQKRDYEIFKYVADLSSDKKRAYAQVLGILPKGKPYEMNIDEVTHDLTFAAKRDFEGFVEGLESPYMKFKNVVLKGLETGVLYLNKNRGTIDWSTGNTMSVTPHGYDEIDAASEMLYNDIDLFNALEARIDARQSKDPLAETKTEKSLILEERTDEDVFDEAKNKKIITWSTPYFVFGEIKLDDPEVKDKGKDNALSFLSKNVSVLNDIKQAIIDLE